MFIQWNTKQKGPNYRYTQQHERIPQKCMLSERSQIKSAYVYEIQSTNLWQ